MDLDISAYGEDHLRMFADASRRALEKVWPAAEHPKALEDLGRQREAWRAFAAQGWLDIGADPDQPSLREAAAVLEELGRAACPLPVLDAILANLAAVAAPPEIRDALAAVRAGAARLSVCLSAYDRDPTADSIEATRDGTGEYLSGCARFIEAAALADLFLVLLDGDRAALVRADAAGVSVAEAKGIAVPSLAGVTFDGAPATVFELGAFSGRDLLSIARLGAISRAVGSCSRAFELASDYAKIRKQFGKPIGAFQAIQHKLANVLIWVDASRALARRAAAAHEAGRPEWRYLCDAAFAFGSVALRRAELEAQHAFGGIAFFEEHELPRHFRRVITDAVRFGGARAARLDVARWLLQQNGPMKLPDLDLGEASNAFRLDVREWLAETLTPEYRAARKPLPPQDRYDDREFTRKLGAKGWLGLAWPAEYGGQARGIFDQLVFQEEMQYARAPQYGHATGVNFIGPALIASGTDEQIRRFLPAILRGEATFCLGYSEPEAGSDLGSLRTKARRDGDEWVIDGVKHFTSRAERSDFVWLTARTDPQSKGSGGVSVFIVPLNSPGIRIHPMIALSRRNANTVFFDEVRVPATALVGEVNQGWKAISTALTAERATMGGNVASMRLYYDLLVAELERQAAEGRPILEDARTLDTLGEYAAEIEAARVLVVQTMAEIAAGRAPVRQASEAKVFSGELQERMAAAAMDLLGAGAMLAETEPDALADGCFEYQVRDGIMQVVGGGTSEIQRSLIATKGLGLPRE